MTDKWKKRFFLLLGLIILFVLVVLIMVNMPIKDKGLSPIADEQEENVQFQIQATKSDLNKIMNHYIEEEGLTSPIAYEVLLNDEVELYGTMKVFTQDIEMKLTFEPEALDNGDVILKQKSISIGQIQLPVSYVLKFIRDQYDFPEWVSIQPNDELVYVSLQRMKLKSDVKVRVNKFDLVNDDIQFSLLVPTN
ncbi:YpmS family protein [Robertmurraya massiliosenegalensis]|uniref:YpmS family protein n=1 Tax=Robertmurraya massiliosenegalensis TaxID=1287657 RepID=UPI0002ED797C|nr:YpmS family protein [Robertmurraya massiliosenegalensis]